MEITGKLIEVTTPQELVGKNGKTYIKAMAILETEGQYPKKVAVDLKEALIDKLSSMPLFSMVTLKINLESREYNGKWYTSITAWSI